MNEIVALSFIMPIMDTCFLFFEFNFFRLYGDKIGSKFLKYGILTVCFLVFAFVMTIYSLNSLYFVYFQYAVPITIFFVDGRKRGYFVSGLAVIAMLVALIANRMFSVKLFGAILLGFIGVLLFCELIQLLPRLKLFTKYVIAMIFINIIIPIGSEYSRNLISTKQLTNTFLPLLVGSILITLFVYAYVKAMQKREAEIQKLKYEASHDELTTLLNYRTFSNYVTQIVADKSSVYTIIMIDLDNFKRVNDKFGHLEGNRLLKKFSIKLNNFFGDKLATQASVFRFGGEEFCLVFKNVPEETAYKLIWKFERSLTDENYLTTDGQQVAISFSGGVASTDQETNIHEAIRKADAAVYLAKSNGRAQIVCPDQADS